ncbi:type II toxin-antitoxin system RelE/ParE family toxin [Mameliella sp. CS4]|uniref:type II toxin-antitoxin system RelE/ParE family toxin n=1 Tax=Mameliella sp. CS4 TaxID=2862329 RepID=UPI001C5ED41F|nr:type II toxin-antitoxin system RelE/ParE family toxin [Mameliella sp. CS4]MBW4985285.1 type II toxin-antitoxin system RelE/ParE family toxin [Mameliella sp. CS4]
MAGYGLTLGAEEDLRAIWSYTFETWGADQADRYLSQIESCCDAIGTRRARSKAFDQLPDDVRILRCEHHYVVWLVASQPIIIAVLHERMDFVQRLKDRL